MRRPSRLAPLLALLAVLLLPTLGCDDDEEPIRETLDLSFHADGTLVATSTVFLRVGDSPAVRARVEREASDLLAGRDAWSARLPAATSLQARLAQEWKHGALVEAQREVTLAPEDVAHVFALSDVVADWRSDGDQRELTLLAAPSTRATRVQTDLLRAAQSAFTRAAMAFVTGASHLYEHLDEHPERAAACFGNFFRPPGVPKPQLTDDEQALIDALDDPLSALVDVFTSNQSGGLSIEQLSDLVHDPFPAAVTVHVEGAVLEHEGFTPADGAWMVPRKSLWSALCGLEQTWISPPLAGPLIDHFRNENLPLPDPDAIALLPRRHAPPASEPALAQTLEDALKPAPTLRLEWRVPPAPATPPVAPPAPAQAPGRR